MEWGTRGEETTCERKEPFWVLDFLCTGLHTSPALGETKLSRDNFNSVSVSAPLGPLTISLQMQLEATGGAYVHGMLYILCVRGLISSPPGR